MSELQLSPEVAARNKAVSNLVPTPEIGTITKDNNLRRGRRGVIPPQVVAARLAQMAELFFQRKTIAQMMVEMNLSKKSIENLRKQLTDVWIERAGARFDEAKAREMAEIDRLQLMYENAYELSKQKHQKQRKDSDYVDAKTPRGRQAAAEDLIDRVRRDKSHAVQVTEKPEGDAKFLDGIMRCIDRRIKLLGLDEPEKFNIGVGVENKNHGRTPVEERIRASYALFGVVVEGDAGSEAEGGASPFDDFAESLDSGDSYIEASGILNPR